jgi:hypothetical protein
MGCPYLYRPDIETLCSSADNLHQASQQQLQPWHPVSEPHSERITGALGRWSLVPQAGNTMVQALFTLAIEYFSLAALSNLFEKPSVG